MATKSQHAAAYRKVPPFLRGLRERAGLTQRDLGDLLDRPQSWVYNCESANRRVDVAEFIAWASVRRRRQSSFCTLPQFLNATTDRTTDRTPSIITAGRRPSIRARAASVGAIRWGWGVLDGPPANMPALAPTTLDVLQNAQVMQARRDPARKNHL